MMMEGNHKKRKKDRQKERKIKQKKFVLVGDGGREKKEPSS